MSLCLCLLAVLEAEEVCLGRFWACLGLGRVRVRALKGFKSRCIWAAENLIFTGRIHAKIWRGASCALQRR